MPRALRRRSAVLLAAEALALLLLAQSGGVLAATPPGATGGPRPSTANAAPCEACHGAHGEGSPSAAIPRLAGQSADYLQKQLRDYASGSRDNPVMRNFAKSLSDSERAQLAMYYASLSAAHAADAAPADARQLARGRELAFQGAEAERVQACNNCHGPDGSGLPHSAPYLAGQSAEYLASALKAWKQGTRKNDSGKLMASVVGRLSDADIAAVSAYFAGETTAN